MNPAYEALKRLKEHILTARRILGAEMGSCDAHFIIKSAGVEFLKNVNKYHDAGDLTQAEIYLLIHDMGDL